MKENQENQEITIQTDNLVPLNMNGEGDGNVMPSYEFYCYDIEQIAITISIVKKEDGLARLIWNDENDLFHNYLRLLLGDLKQQLNKLISSTNLTMFFVKFIHSRNYHEELKDILNYYPDIENQEGHSRENRFKVFQVFLNLIEFFDGLITRLHVKSENRSVIEQKIMKGPAAWMSDILSRYGISSQLNDNIDHHGALVDHVVKMLPEVLKNFKNTGSVVVKKGLVDNISNCNIM